MTTTMSTAQLLRATADHLRTYGWAKGKFYAPKPIVKPVAQPLRYIQEDAGPMHVETVVGQDYDHAPACMLGALGVVSGAREHLQYGNQQMIGAALGTTPEVQAYRRAVQVLERTIAEQTRGYFRDVANFNDDLLQGQHGTTLEQVLDMLEAAAVVAEFEQARIGEFRQVMTDSMATTMAAINAMKGDVIATAEVLKATLAALEPEPEPTPEIDAVMTLTEAAAVVDAAVEAVAA